MTIETETALSQSAPFYCPSPRTNFNPAEAIVIQVAGIPRASRVQQKAIRESPEPDLAPTVECLDRDFQSVVNGGAGTRFGHAGI